MSLQVWLIVPSQSFNHKQLEVYNSVERIFKVRDTI
jgi:hypothetical protein